MNSNFDIAKKKKTEKKEKSDILEKPSMNMKNDLATKIKTDNELFWSCVQTKHKNKSV